MGIARSVLGLSLPKVIFAMALCVAVEVFAVILGFFPMLETSLTNWAEKYDVYFPEITIQDGQASIREKQPYYIEDFGDSRLVLVIDTTITSYDEAMRHLKDTEYGAVLTRSTIINKDRGEVKVVSLKQLPDMVINSDNLRKVVDQLGPMMKSWGIVFLSILFMLTKLIQAFALALVPYLGMRLLGDSIHFEEGFKLAAVCMVVPVGIGFFLSFSGMSIFTILFSYYAIYLLVLVIVTRDYVREVKQIAWIAAVFVCIGVIVMELFLCVVGMVMVVEGLPYFGMPDKMKELMTFVQQQEDSTLRMVGGILVLLGLFIVFVARRALPGSLLWMRP